MSTLGDDAELARDLSTTVRFLESSSGPQEKYPGLELTGNVISAAFRIPYEVGYRSGNSLCTWELVERNGDSALISSFKHLASAATPWKHTLVGWTGQIRKTDEVDFINLSQARDRKNDPDRPRTSKPVEIFKRVLADGRESSGSGLSANDGVGYAGFLYRAIAQSLEAEKAAAYFKVLNGDLQTLEQALEQTSYGTIRPVWLGIKDHDDNLLLSSKNQVSYERFAEQDLYKFLARKDYSKSSIKTERDEEDWDHYVKINKAFADCILEAYLPGDIIWVHDYHLMLLPAMLKQRIPYAFIGFHLHAPYPAHEHNLAPHRISELLQGTLSADCIGVQNSDFAKAFIKACQQTLDAEVDSWNVTINGVKTPVSACPIGIDVGQIQQMAFNNPVTERKLKELQAEFKNVKVVVGCDRLDSIRDIGLKLDTFKTFLERNSDDRKKVVLVQISSFTSFQQGKESWTAVNVQRRVENRIGLLNQKYSSDDGLGSKFQPVIYYDEHLHASDYFALLRLADVCLLSEGSTTTCRDFILCQKNSHKPLIMSMTSGSAENLPAIHINPQAHEVNAQQLKAALEMTREEKDQRHGPLYKRVTTQTVSHWSNEMILELLDHVNKRNCKIVNNALDLQVVQQQYNKATKRLFLFDYDGTLTPIVEDPALAIPSHRLLRTLKVLTADSQNQVWIISGRDQAFLESWFGSVEGLGLSAEHGSFSRKPHTRTWEGVPAHELTALHQQCIPIFQKYSDKAPGSWIETKKITITWHYRHVDPEIGETLASALKEELEEKLATWNVVIMSGKANIELRPRGINKGVMTTEVLNHYRHRTIATSHAPDFVLCFGDDKTDEDMFQALLRSNLRKENVFSCFVGAADKRTLAQYFVPDPAAVVNILASLVL